MTPPQPVRIPRSAALRIRAYQALRVALHPVWPYTCPVCGSALAYSEWPICLGCLARLPRPVSDLTLPYIGAPGNSVTVISWFTYNPEWESHHIIHDIKYHNRPYLARQAGREFALERLAAGPRFDLIIPIPLHWTKLVSRGYNQTARIARGVADITGAKVSRNLYARRPHDTQTQLERHQRQANVAGIFGLRHPEQLAGRHIALLDDVYTTGATLTEALRTILTATTPATITLLTLARTLTAR